MRTELSLCLALVVACDPLPVDNENTLEPRVLVPACQANNDGVIARDELTFVPGLRARYRVREDEAGIADDIDTRGAIESGTHTWDLSRPDPQDDAVARLGLESIEGHWFADQFPSAEFVAPLDARGQLLGPTRVDDSGVHLLGFASRDPAPPEGESLAIYDQEVTLTPLPLELGLRRTESARATNAVLLGIPNAFDDSYTIEVDKVGRLVLPDLVLENTLRITVRLERTLLAGEVAQTTHTFMHECLGEVARATGAPRNLDEAAESELDTIVELRRLSL